MRKSLAIPLGLGAAVVVAATWPGPIIRWLARRSPEVLYSVDTPDLVVALTIDDAPHPTLTPAILDLLQEQDAHATFFVIGKQIAGNEPLVARMVAEGHELGNHLMTTKASILLSGTAFARQLRQTDELLTRFGPVRWFRPGSGFYSRRMLDQLRQHGYRCALGSAYAYDSHVRSIWYVSRHLLGNVRPGAVIILHDGSPSRWRTVAVLRQVLPELRRRGYRVVTLSELVDGAAGRHR